MVCAPAQAIADNPDGALKFVGVLGHLKIGEGHRAFGQLCVMHQHLKRQGGFKQVQVQKSVELLGVACGQAARVHIGANGGQLLQFVVGFFDKHAGVFMKLRQICGFDQRQHLCAAFFNDLAVLFQRCWNLGGVRGQEMRCRAAFLLQLAHKIRCHQHDLLSLGGVETRPFVEIV